MIEINRKTVQRIIDTFAARAKTERGKWTCGSVQVHSNGYAELGYMSPEHDVVCLGNWNTITKWNDVTHKHDIIDDAPRRLGDALDTLGIECEWEDEWTSCDNCGKLVRTEANCYCWQPSFIRIDGDTVCIECVKSDKSIAEDYLQSLECDDTTADNTTFIDPIDHGYIKIQEYESGWHPGQTDDPKKIAKCAEQAGATRWLFAVTEQSQFYIGFALYVHKEDMAHKHNRNGFHVRKFHQLEKVTT